MLNEILSKFYLLFLLFQAHHSIKIKFKSFLEFISKCNFQKTKISQCNFTQFNNIFHHQQYHF